MVHVAQEEGRSWAERKETRSVLLCHQFSNISPCLCERFGRSDYAARPGKSRLFAASHGRIIGRLGALENYDCTQTEWTGQVGIMFPDCRKSERPLEHVILLQSAGAWKRQARLEIYYVYSVDLLDMRLQYLARVWSGSALGRFEQAHAQK